MTMFTGTPIKVKKILESQYEADIAAAEERGRLAAAQAAPVVPAAEVEVPRSMAAAVTPTREQQEAMDIIKAAQQAASGAGNHPEANDAQIQEHMRAAHAEGRMISKTQAGRELEAVGLAADTAKAGATIDAQIAKAKAEGRTIGGSQALAELRTKAKVGSPRQVAGMIDDRVAKAKSEGRKLSGSQAMAELRREGLLPAQ